ncbi:MAG: aldo/keto reductase [Phycisphaerales bacterium]|nr:aldo/keto reductase [Phycisphaerales bacterium]
MRSLGRSGMDVSSVALGCMSLCGNAIYPGIPEAQAVATIDAALDAGINFFDTAPAYGDGESERRVGRALDGLKRDRAIVATKISSATLTAEDVMRELDHSLRRLRTDRVDLYQIHWPRPATPIDQTLRALEDAVKAGKIRAIGVCNFGRQDLGDAINVAPVVSNQMVYSLLARAVEQDVVPFGEANGVDLLCYSPLAQGLLTGAYRHADEVPAGRSFTRLFAGTRPQARHGEAGLETETFAAVAEIRSIAQSVGLSMADLSLAWLLHRATVASVLVGASRPEQVTRNAAAADVQLSPEIIARLDAATADVKAKLGANPDMWQSDSRIH